MLLLCCVLLWFGIGQFTHIFQGYFTGIGAIKWLPQYQWSNPEDHVTLKDMGKWLTWIHQERSQQNKAQ